VCKLEADILFASGASGSFETGGESRGVGAAAIVTACADMGAIPTSVFAARYLAGEALNFSLHPEQQK
jgi:hypothetical protein